MKTFFLILSLALISLSAMGQAVIKEATQAEVDAGTGRNYVSPRRLAAWPGGGGASGALTNNETRSVNLTNSANIFSGRWIGKTNVVNPLLGYGTTGVYPNDTTLALQRAVTNLDYAGGVLWLPNGTYTTTNTIVLGSGKQVNMPHVQFDYGNYDVLGDGLARFYPLHNTNTLYFNNNLRRVRLDNINIHGQNTGQTNNTTYIGVASVGPSGGNATWSRLNIQDMGVGVVLNDMTGLNVEESTFAYNFIGAATAYKPDGVKFEDCIFVRGYYGAFLQWSNAQFTSLSAVEGFPLFDNCIFGQNQVGAVVPRGHVVFQSCYWESNGTNGEPYVAVQAGMNPDVVYERAFTNLWGEDPKLHIIDGSFNNFHLFKAYRRSEYTFDKTKVGKFSINLMNAQADDSLVVSDVETYVTNSAGAYFLIDKSCYFNSNTVVYLHEKIATLTDGANIATDVSRGTVFRVTLGGNRTIDNPTYGYEGKEIEYQITQDGTGNRTVTWGSEFTYGDDLTGVTLTTTASKTDFIRWKRRGSEWELRGVIRGY